MRAVRFIGCGLTTAQVAARAGDVHWLYEPKRGRLELVPTLEERDEEEEAMKKSRKLYGRQTFQLAPGLSKSEAYKAASKKARKDFRGCSYDRKTGLVVLT